MIIFYHRAKSDGLNGSFISEQIQKGLKTGERVHLPQQHHLELPPQWSSQSHPTFLEQLIGRLPTNTVLLLFWASSSFLALFLWRFSTQCSTPFSSVSCFLVFFTDGFCCSSSSAICRPISLEAIDGDDGWLMGMTIKQEHEEQGLTCPPVSFQLWTASYSSSCRWGLVDRWPLQASFSSPLDWCLCWPQLGGGTQARWPEPHCRTELTAASLKLQSPFGTNFLTPDPARSQLAVVLATSSHCVHECQSYNPFSGKQNKAKKKQSQSKLQWKVVQFY